jgi:hypothetical protein
MGNDVQQATMSVVSRNIPSHFGWATTAWNVAFGDVMMPMNRDKNPCAGTEVAPDGVEVSVIEVVE